MFNQGCYSCPSYCRITAMPLSQLLSQTHHTQMIPSLAFIAPQPRTATETRLCQLQGISGLRLNEIHYCQKSSEWNEMANKYEPQTIKAMANLRLCRPDKRHYFFQTQVMLLPVSNLVQTTVTFRRGGAPF